jgi:hypothetical protein
MDFKLYHKRNGPWNEIRLISYEIIDVCEHGDQPHSSWKDMYWPLQYVHSCRDGHDLKDFLGVTSKVGARTTYKQTTLSSNLSLSPR